MYTVWAGYGLVRFRFSENELQRWRQKQFLLGTSWFFYLMRQSDTESNHNEGLWFNLSAAAYFLPSHRVYTVSPVTPLKTTWMWSISQKLVELWLFSLETWTDLSLNHPETETLTAPLGSSPQPWGIVGSTRSWPGPASESLWYLRGRQSTNIQTRHYWGRRRAENNNTHVCTCGSTLCRLQQHTEMNTLFNWNTTNVMVSTDNNK